MEYDDDDDDDDDDDNASRLSILHWTTSCLDTTVCEDTLITAPCFN
jgi:hypothetical protein